jgi:hypothetical protein
MSIDDLLEQLYYVTGGCTGHSNRLHPFGEIIDDE